MLYINKAINNYFLLLILLLMHGETYCNPGIPTIKPSVLYEINYGYSRLMTEYNSLYRDPFNIIEFRAAKQTAGAKLWQQDFGFPEVGLSMVFGDLGFENGFGHTFGLVPDITLNTLSNKRFGIKVRLGIGLAYCSQHFDEALYPENIYIGSTIVNMSKASFVLHTSLSENIYVQYGINYYHLSNGHYQVPNVGMNLPGFLLGIKYFPNSKNIPEKTKQKSNTVSNWKFNINAGLGVHEFARTLGPVGGPKYMINTVELGLYKHKNYAVNFRTGISIKYYSDYLAYGEKYHFFDPIKKKNATVISIYGGNEFLLHRTGVFIQTGIDLYAPFEKKYLALREHELNFNSFMEEFVSSKIGLNYYFKDMESNDFLSPYLGFFIKTNFGMADFIGAHIGILL